MSKLHNHSLNNALRILCATALLAMVFIAIFIYHANVVALFIFFLFLIFYVQIPGFFILRLANVQSNHISSQLLISFFAGWFLIILEYFLTELIGTNLLLYSLGPILSGTCIYAILYKRISSPKKINFNKISIVAMIFAVLTLFYVLLNTQYIFLSPEVSTSIYASVDKYYQMGLINSLSQGYPLANPWVAGRYVYYHIFTQILYSVPVRLFALDSWFIIMSCAPYVTAFILSLSFYSMFRYFCKAKSRAGLYSLSVFLSHMFIARTPTTSYLYRVLLVNDNFPAFGVAAAIAWLIVLDLITTENYSNNRKVPVSQIGLLTAIMILMTGIKAPIALVMIGGLLGTLILSLIMKSIKLQPLIIFLTSLIGFFIVYESVITPPTSSSTGNTMFIFGKMTGIAFWKKPLIEFMTSISIPSILRLGIILLVFFISFFTIYFLPVIIGYLRELVLVLRRRKNFDFARINIYASFLVGLILMMFLSFSGHSQIYFGLIAAAFAPLIAFWFFEDVEFTKTSAWMRSIAKMSKVYFILVLIVTVTSLSTGMLNQFNKAKARANPNFKHNIYRSLTPNEYEAMSWIKENTPEEALFATQKQASVAPENYSYQNRWTNCHFQYASFSDRSFYIEGSGFSLSNSEWEIRKELIETNNKLYDVNNPKRGDLAKSLGIDYVIVSKDLGYKDLTNADYTSCYSNPEIKIYKISPK